MRRKLRTRLGRTLYSPRKYTVEPVLGQIKAAFGFRPFCFRGLVEPLLAGDRRPFPRSPLTSLLLSATPPPSLRPPFSSQQSSRQPRIELARPAAGRLCIQCIHTKAARQEVPSKGVETATRGTLEGCGKGEGGVPSW